MSNSSESFPRGGAGSEVLATRVISAIWTRGFSSACNVLAFSPCTNILPTLQTLAHILPTPNLVTQLEGIFSNSKRNLAVTHLSESGEGSGININLVLNFIVLPSCFLAPFPVRGLYVLSCYYVIRTALPLHSSTDTWLRLVKGMFLFPDPSKHRYLDAIEACSSRSFKRHFEFLHFYPIRMACLYKTTPLAEAPEWKNTRKYIYV